MVFPVLPSREISTGGGGVVGSGVGVGGVTLQESANTVNQRLWIVTLRTMTELLLTQIRLESTL